ncbi:MAG: AfsR/SARP family transcriptional regulator [Micromonosporaceae bacterium]
MRFQVLGPLDVLGPEGTIWVTGRRRRALLGVLLLHAGRLLTLPGLVDAIWADNPPRSAIANIRSYACDLRRLLQCAGDSPSRLATHAAGYRLSAGPDELDLLEFQKLVTDGQCALRRGDQHHAADRLGCALGLWRGRALEDLIDLGPAISARLAALEEQRWTVAADWVDARLALGHHHELIPMLWEMVAEHPFWERSRVQLMTALHAAGRTADALAVFREARHITVDELGVEPGPDLQRVHTAILRSEPASAGVRRRDANPGPVAQDRQVLAS